MKQTMVEKMFSLKNTCGTEVKAGDLVTARLDGAVLLLPADSVDEHLKDAGISCGLPWVWDKEKVYYVMDHFQPAVNSHIANRNKAGREMARRLGLKYFYDSMPAVGHQVVCEKGYVKPGELVIGIDSHATMYGALNCFGTGIGEADMAYALMFGELWFQVPQTIKIVLEGSRRKYPFSKDILLYLAGKYGDDFAQYKALEFSGEYSEKISIDERLCLSCQSVDIGAKFGLFEFDDKTRAFYNKRNITRFDTISADDNAVYEQVISVNVDDIPFTVAKPHRLCNSVDVNEVSGTRIDQAVIGSCANGRYEDIEIAARIIKGKHINPDVRFLIQPASWDIYRRCMEEGLVSTILDAGAFFLEPGCGSCQPLKGCLADGEVCITSTTRNYKGRMGSADASIYLGDPATVAASALAGEITDPTEVLDEIL